MNQDKHFYIIIGLLVVIVVLLVVVLVQQGKPATDLVDEASSNIDNCNKAVAEWKQKYPEGTVATELARNELSLILSNCASQIGEND